MIDSGRMTSRDLVSGVLFILSLRGLSSPATSQAGARNGMIGMAIAVVTTLWMLWEGSGSLDAPTLNIIAGGIAVGGIAGGIVAQKIKMTAMPQLVAFFHSLVGLAAVLVAAAAFYAPASYGIGETGNIHLQSLIELSLGSASSDRPLTIAIRPASATSNCLRRVFRSGSGRTSSGFSSMGASVPSRSRNNAASDKRTAFNSSVHPARAMPQILTCSAGSLR